MGLIGRKANSKNKTSKREIYAQPKVVLEEWTRSLQALIDALRENEEAWKSVFESYTNVQKATTGIYANLDQDAHACLQALQHGRANVNPGHPNNPSVALTAIADSLRELKEVLTDISRAAELQEKRMKDVESYINAEIKLNNKADSAKRTRCEFDSSQFANKVNTHTDTVYNKLEAIDIKRLQVTDRAIRAMINLQHYYYTGNPASGSKEIMIKHKLGCRPIPRDLNQTWLQRMPPKLPVNWTYNNNSQQPPPGNPGSSTGTSGPYPPEASCPDLSFHRNPSRRPQATYPQNRNPTTFQSTLPPGRSTSSISLSPADSGNFSMLPPTANQCYGQPSPPMTPPQRTNHNTSPSGGSAGQSFDQPTLIKVPTPRPRNQQSTLHQASSQWQEFVPSQQAAHTNTSETLQRNNSSTSASSSGEVIAHAHSVQNAAQPSAYPTPHPATQPVWPPSSSGMPPQPLVNRFERRPTSIPTPQYISHLSPESQPASQTTPRPMPQPTQISARQRPSQQGSYPTVQASSQLSPQTPPFSVAKPSQNTTYSTAQATPHAGQFFAPQPSSQWQASVPAWQATHTITSGTLQRNNSATSATSSGELTAPAHSVQHAQQPSALPTPQPVTEPVGPPSSSGMAQYSSPITQPTSPSSVAQSSSSPVNRFERRSTPQHMSQATSKPAPQYIRNPLPESQPALQTSPQPKPQLTQLPNPQQMPQTMQQPTQIPALQIPSQQASYPTVQASSQLSSQTPPFSVVQPSQNTPHSMPQTTPQARPSVAAQPSSQPGVFSPAPAMPQAVPVSAPQPVIYSGMQRTNQAPVQIPQYFPQSMVQGHYSQQPLPQSGQTIWENQAQAQPQPQKGMYVPRRQPSSLVHSFMNQNVQPMHAMQNPPSIQGQQHQPSAQGQQHQ